MEAGVGSIFWLPLDDHCWRTKGELWMRMPVLPTSWAATAVDGRCARTLARKGMVGWDGGGTLLYVLKGAQGQLG